MQNRDSRTMTTGLMQWIHATSGDNSNCRPRSCLVISAAGYNTTQTTRKTNNVQPSRTSKTTSEFPATQECSEYPHREAPPTTLKYTPCNSQHHMVKEAKARNPPRFRAFSPISTCTELANPKSIKDVSSTIRAMEHLHVASDVLATRKVAGCGLFDGPYDRRMHRQCSTITKAKTEISVINTGNSPLNQELLGLGGSCDADAVISLGGLQLNGRISTVAFGIPPRTRGSEMYSRAACGCRVLTRVK